MTPTQDAVVQGRQIVAHVSKKRYHEFRTAMLENTGAEQTGKLLEHFQGIFRFDPDPDSGPDPDPDGGNANPCREATSYVTKRRYHELESVLQERVGAERAGELLQVFEQVFNFDPYKSGYSVEQAGRIKAWRARKVQETGQSLYIINGVKRAYDRDKARRESSASSVPCQQSPGRT